MSDAERALARARRRAIGKRIKQARKQKGLSQSELAAFAGVEAQSISKQERGVFSPAVDTLFLIADACGVDPRWLVMGEPTAEATAEALPSTGTDD